MVIPTAVGFLVTFLPQIYLWHVLYGSWITSPYFTQGLGFNLLSPHLLEVLFSPNNGLFFWTPILAIAIIGLVRASMHDRKKIFWLLLVISEWYLIASWAVWWQGGSYSGRMFISLLPLFAFGLAEIFQWLKTKMLLGEYLSLVIVGPLAMINFVFMVGYLFTH